MNCQEVQCSLSLYLYGELDFAQEEELESHLAECAACQLALAREKQWHTISKGQAAEPAIDLLSACRELLRSARVPEKAPPARSWWQWGNLFDISLTRWSGQVALASMLVFVGFASARWLDRSSVAPQKMSVLDLSNAQVRDIRSDQAGNVRIVIDEQREITGRIDDAQVQRLLVSATRHAEPEVRMDSFEILTALGSENQQAELQGLLADTVRTDPNPAVRLKAVYGLRRFAGHPATLEALKFVLEHDDDQVVRSQAIDVLVPQDGPLDLTPALTEAMQDVMRSAQEDEYVRGRCSQVLHWAKQPVVY
jgi:hypothetical protein